MSASVEVDTSDVERGMRQLAAGLDASGTAAARRQAEATAGDVRRGVPRRTGRLAATVGTTPVDGGYGVTYGGTLPYADYIERRAHAVERGTSGAATTFGRAMQAVARTEVGKL